MALVDRTNEGENPSSLPPERLRLPRCPGNPSLGLASASSVLRGSIHGNPLFLVPSVVSAEQLLLVPPRLPTIDKEIYTEREREVISSTILLRSCFLASLPSSATLLVEAGFHYARSNPPCTPRSSSPFY